MVDDVWRDSQLRPFFTLPEQARLLITTRQRDLLLRLGEYLAPEELLELDVLEGPHASALLGATAGFTPNDHASELELLAQLVGGLPLMLTVMGNYLRLRLSSKPEWFPRALVALRAASTAAAAVMSASIRITLRATALKPAFGAAPRPLSGGVPEERSYFRFGGEAARNGTDMV